MQYRAEIDGLRALAVVPVVLYHAGLGLFSGGFVGVDVFFVISGYLITTIIVSELRRDTFSLTGFYERRARRILPALFLVVATFLPFSWLFLMPRDMQLFSGSLLSVVTFSSNFFFWKHSGYFDVAAELNPLLHTWSLAVEEQYYLIFPLILMTAGKVGWRWLAVLGVTVFLASLMYSEWASQQNAPAGFYLLTSRAWELLLGSGTAMWMLLRPGPPHNTLVANLGSAAGLTLLLFSVFSYGQDTPFPGGYALLPTMGTALIILFAVPGTLVCKLLSNRLLVGTGLVSYSYYLWHQPMFALARYVSPSEPELGLMLLLAAVALLLAWCTWRFVETPFRNPDEFSSRRIVRFSLAGSAVLVLVGVTGQATQGFSGRFDIAALPRPWEGIQCHGAASLAAMADPLSACLGANANRVPGDFFLLGDSHAAQLTFPLKKISERRDRQLFFINSESEEDFPYAYWRGAVVEPDPIVARVIANAEAGDNVVITFHRGRLNDERDMHIPVSEAVADNEKSRMFLDNMQNILPALLARGANVYLVKDGPLLSLGLSLERCAWLKAASDERHCSVTWKQDVHTRSRQDQVFDALAKEFDGVEVLDILPVLYAGKNMFSPTNEKGDYRMFDTHHLTESTALKLLPYLSEAIPRVY